MSKLVTVTQNDGILQLTLNRPDKKNALNVAMYTALGTAITKADATDDVRVIVINATGTDFCSGNDLVDFVENTPEISNSPIIEFIDAIAHAKTPIVAGVRGLAVGIGATLLGHCDLVYADETARFMYPFTGLGLCPEAGSTLLLPALSGRQRANEALLLGKPLSVEETYDLGLVSRIVSADALDETVAAAAAKLAQLPQDALLTSKRLINGTVKAQLKTAIDAETVEFDRLLKTPDAQARLQKFVQKK